MCMNCLSGVELAIMQGTAAVVVAKAGLVRIHERVTGTDPMVRRLAAHRANAEFLAGMGLDPDAVLGPAPTAAPAPAPATARTRRAGRGRLVPASAPAFAGG